jgi:site-specific recombinase XerD
MPNPLSDPLPDTVTQHLDWLAGRELSESTTRQRQAVLHRLTAHAGIVDPLEATREQVEAWYAATAGKDRSTRRTEIMHAKQYYRWAIRFDLRTDDPTRRITPPKVKSYKPRPISESALALAMAAASGDVLVIVACGALAGLRAAEIARLRWSDLDHDAGVIHVVGKGRKPRVVPLGAALAAILAAHRPLGGPVYVLARHDRGGLAPAVARRGHQSPARVSQLWSEFARPLGITASLHQARHRFATILLQRTKDLRLVQECMGHSSPSITAIYTYVIYDQAAHDAIDGLAL